MTDAAELEDVLAGDVAQDPQLRFEDLRGTPGETPAGCQLVAVLGLVLVAVCIPRGTVASFVGGQVEVAAIAGHARHCTRSVGRRDIDMAKPADILARTRS